MLTSPVCSGAFANERVDIPALKVRRPFRINSFARRHTQAPAINCRHCCSKARRRGTHTRCQASAHEEGGSGANDFTSKWSLSSSLGLGFEWAAPFVAAALPLSEHFGGGNSNGAGGGGGGGGGSGDGSSEGSGQGNNNGSSIVAGIAAIPGKRLKKGFSAAKEVDNDQADGESAANENEKADGEDHKQDQSQRKVDPMAPPPDVKDPRVPDGWDYWVDAVRITNLDMGLESTQALLDEILPTLITQPGFPVSESELRQDCYTLTQQGLFFDARVHISPSHIRGSAGKNILFRCAERLYVPVSSIEVYPESPDVESLKMPRTEVQKALNPEKPWCRPGGYNEDTVKELKRFIEKWYSDNGYACAYVKEFDGLDDGAIRASVVEGIVQSVSVVNERPEAEDIDDSNDDDIPLWDTKRTTSESRQEQPTWGPPTLPMDIIERELPFKIGEPYRVEDGNKALQNLTSYGIFEDVELLPNISPENENMVDIRIETCEESVHNTDVELEWDLAPKDGGRIPRPDGIFPGGTLSYENQNFMGRGDMFSAEMEVSDFFDPGDDTTLQVNYRRNYFWGAPDRLRTTLDASAFSVNNTSGVFTASPSNLNEEVPPVFVGRAGAKFTLIEEHTGYNSANYGLVLEQVTTRNEEGELVGSSNKILPTGQEAPFGPPTTHSSKGVDRILQVQGNVTRDTTEWKQGTQVGTRWQFAVEQSLLPGLGPFYNKHSASFTRFLGFEPDPRNWKMALLGHAHNFESKSTRPPAVLVMHGRYAGIIGDAASYDLFTLGGPYSVRGYQLGELASGRRVLETAAELRVPVQYHGQLPGPVEELNKHLGKVLDRIPGFPSIPRQKLDATLYGFVEHGTDLGSSKDVVGNPTQYFRKPGSGSSFGAGLKVGALRTECVWNSNSGRRGIWCHFGERF